ncbi:uncharacterized protein [Littorina saxatilis]|uniref:Mediator of RNA polymerase II transcription subunit 15 n=1 Tax=Littorina saxatilis TaxID=31220 RepID=A0AAN9FXI6_9CAEN
MAGMAGEFMANWQSKFFRERIVAQIAGAKEDNDPDPHSDDTMEKFLAQNTSEQLEEFIYNKSEQREDYLSLAADLLLAMRQCKGRPGQGRENLDMPNGASPNGDHKEEEGTKS